MAMMRIHIQGHGVVKVKIPKKVDKKAYRKGIADTVVKTMSLVEPQGKRFHPALGYYHATRT